MADSLISILDQLNNRITELNMQNSRLRLRNEELLEENENLRRAADEAKGARDKALLDSEYLAVSHKLADNPETLVAARRHISQLIRNIDRCIDMLKE